jgi:4-amino-4-deoxy-L-arabinose transferase-like glycosyltransferase
MEKQSFLKQHLAPIFCELLTLFLALNYTRQQGFTSIPERNGDWYIGYGFMLAGGHGYHACNPGNEPGDYHCTVPMMWPTAYRLPGYPYYLAANILLFGRDAPLVPIRLLQGVLAALIAFMTSRLAQRLAGNWAALLAGIFIATNPLFHVYTQWLYTEMLFTFLLLCGLLLLSYSPRWWKLLLAGVALGAAMLTRGNVVLMLPMLPFIYKPLRKLIPVGIGVLLIVAPWAIRNATLLNEFIPFSTGAGTVIWGASNPETFGIEPLGPPTGDWIAPPPLPKYLERENMTEAEFDRAEQRAALDFIRTVPIDRLVWVVLARLNLLRATQHSWIIGDPVAWLFVLSLIIAVMAIFNRTVRQQLKQVLSHRVIWLMLAAILATILNAAYFYGSERFRMPIDPYISVLLSMMIVFVIRKIVLYVRLRTAQ